MKLDIFETMIEFVLAEWVMLELHLYTLLKNLLKLFKIALKMQELGIEWNVSSSSITTFTINM